MSLCPKCRKDSNCSCSNCQKRIDPQKLMEEFVDKGIGLFRCPYCKYEYHYGESEDLELSLIREKESNE